MTLGQVLTITSSIRNTEALCANVLCAVFNTSLRFAHKPVPTNQLTTAGLSERWMVVERMGTGVGTVMCSQKEQEIISHTGSQSDCPSTGTLSRATGHPVRQGDAQAGYRYSCVAGRVLVLGARTREFLGRQGCVPHALCRGESSESAVGPHR